MILYTRFGLDILQDLHKNSMRLSVKDKEIFV